MFGAWQFTISHMTPYSRRMESSGGAGPAHAAVMLEKAPSVRMSTRADSAHAHAAEPIMYSRI